MSPSAGQGAGDEVTPAGGVQNGTATVGRGLESELYAYQTSQQSCSGWGGEGRALAQISDDRGCHSCARRLLTVLLVTMRNRNLNVLSQSDGRAKWAHPYPGMLLIDTKN